jgi:hypothetical protein
MRFAALFCSALIAMTSWSTQRQTADSTQLNSDDRYSVAAVRSALQFLLRPGGSYSFEEKEYLWPLMPLGDRVSIAALKIYPANELVQAEKTQAYLTAVRNAFSARKSIREQADADPTVTLFVLEFLKEKQACNPGIEKRIQYIERCVKDFTCSSQGEYSFFRDSQAAH